MKKKQFYPIKFPGKENGVRKSSPSWDYLQINLLSPPSFFGFPIDNISVQLALDRRAKIQKGTPVKFLIRAYILYLGWCAKPKQSPKIYLKSDFYCFLHNYLDLNLAIAFIVQGLQFKYLRSTVKNAIVNKSCS